MPRLNANQTNVSNLETVLLIRTYACVIVTRQRNGGTQGRGDHDPWNVIGWAEGAVQNRSEGSVRCILPCPSSGRARRYACQCPKRTGYSSSRWRSRSHLRRNSGACLWDGSFHFDAFGKPSATPTRAARLDGLGAAENLTTPSVRRLASEPRLRSAVQRGRVAWWKSCEVDAVPARNREQRPCSL